MTKKTYERINLAISASIAILMILVLTMAAWAQDAGVVATAPPPILPPDPSSSDLFTQFLSALGSGNYVLVGLLATAAVVWLGEHYGSKVWSALGSPIPSAVLALVLSTAVAVVNTVASGGKLSLTLVLGALSMGFIAWGGPTKLISLFTGVPGTSSSPASPPKS